MASTSSNIEGDNIDQAFASASALHQEGRFAEAENLYRRILSADPAHFAARHMLGVLCLQQGRNAEAAAHIAEALQIAPQATEALLHSGVALQALGRLQEALGSYDRALALRPDYASAFNNRGNVLKDMGRFAEALASYEAALALHPGHVDAHYNRGVVLSELERLPEALAGYDAVLAIQPGHVAALHNRGLVLQTLKRFEEALASYDRALALAPGLVTAHNNRGSVLMALHRYEEALAGFDRMLALAPNGLEAVNNRGAALNKLKQYDAALACFDRVLARDPDFVSALINRGVVLRECKRPAEAVACHERALALAPDHAEAWFNQGAALFDLKRYAEALASYEKTLRLDPEHRYALGGAIDAAENLCDLPARERLAGLVKAAIAAGKAVISPFALVNLCGDPGLQRTCAEAYVKDRIPFLPPPLWRGAPHRNAKIRLAYLSADFHSHATAQLMAGLFERHDRTRFEVTAISFGPDDGSDMRARLVKAFDRFEDVRGRGDAEVARSLAASRIDIAVDLKGHTNGERLAILAHRPCPVQVQYLGYPGTLGAPFIDYVIADRVVLPFDQQPFFTEKIVHLPDSYQVNDSRRRVAPVPPSRREQGLPEDAFVFCCFNNNWKISRPTFALWMRLLAQVPASVCWFLHNDADAKANLRREAAASGIDPDRLVFSPRLPLAEHLARHALADLFVDTLPNNAHTTSSDALWAGLPLVTCLGEAFAGRVAASLLTAVGLPELVTRSSDEYEALVLALARDPDRLAMVRRKLADQLPRAPLFDTDRFRRHIEAAYTQMLEIAERGETPKSFFRGSDQLIRWTL